LWDFKKIQLTNFKNSFLARIAKERKDRLIEEVRRHFGYTVHAKDERFKELLEKKEKEQKKALKEAKKQAKEAKMLDKIASSNKKIDDDTKKSKEEEQWNNLF
jgi:hypothetical protein